MLRSDKCFFFKYFHKNYSDNKNISKIIRMFHVFERYRLEKINRTKYLKEDCVFRSEKLFFFKYFHKNCSDNKNISKIVRMFDVFERYRLEKIDRTKYLKEDCVVRSDKRFFFKYFHKNYSDNKNISKIVRVFDFLALPA